MSSKFSDTVISVKHFPQKTSLPDLKANCEVYGEIKTCNLIQDNGEIVALFEFQTPESAATAVSGLKDFKIQESPIEVDFASHELIQSAINGTRRHSVAPRGQGRGGFRGRGRGGFSGHPGSHEDIIPSVGNVRFEKEERPFRERERRSRWDEEEKEEDMPRPWAGRPRVPEGAFFRGRGGPPRPVRGRYPPVRPPPARDDYYAERRERDPYAIERRERDPYAIERRERDPYAMERRERDPYAMERRERDPYPVEEDPHLMPPENYPRSMRESKVPPEAAPNSVVLQAFHTLRQKEPQQPPHPRDAHVQTNLSALEAQNRMLQEQVARLTALTERQREQEEREKAREYEMHPPDMALPSEPANGVLERLLASPAFQRQIQQATEYGGAHLDNIENALKQIMDTTSAGHSSHVDPDLDRLLKTLLPASSSEHAPSSYERAQNYGPPAQQYSSRHYNEPVRDANYYY